MFGLLGPNGVFIYYLLLRPDDFQAAMRNPLTLAFIIEAFLVTALLAVLIARTGLGKWGWKAFIALSLIGGLGFSVPLYALLGSKTEAR